ncbi:hypothetical protein [Tautonia rosea]|uniref:hypothetical protein n=1 Tax=Tautonia rosea TaxID=2728037 RepID=UPI0014742BEA|nr:hypothetical protein [Tautonia rosea]
MPDETAEDRPLKLAISAMRTALDTAIGEELGRLLGGHSQPLPEGDSPDRVVGPREPSSWRASPVRDGVDPSPPFPPRTQSPASSATDRPETSNTVTPDSPNADDSETVERRLDALAHRLEGRLRRTRDRDPHRPRSDDGSSPDPNRS